MEFISRITAVLLTLMLLPLLIAITLGSFFIQGRPIIYRQKRIGKNFKEFIIYKFRSMKNENDDLKTFKTGKVPKATQWGRFLRKSKLDELPQLINVIKGDMRFIGPRPEVPEFVTEDSFSFLNTIKPGLSGYSSILFRNESEIWSMIDSDDPYNEILKIKVGLDKYYVKRKGFWQDLKLVGITILSLFIPKQMGHYLLINLLKIEDNNEFKLREIISNVKIKNIDQSKVKEDTTANLRILVFADVIAVLCGFMFALYIRNDFLTPEIFLDITFFHILGVCVAAKLLSFYLCDL